MKHCSGTLILAAGLFFAGFSLCGATFDELVRKGEESNTMNQRLSCWREAAALGGDAKALFELCEKAASLARRINALNDEIYFSELMLKSPQLPKERKNSLTFDLLVAKGKAEEAAQKEEQAKARVEMKKAGQSDDDMLVLPSPFIPPVKGRDLIQQWQDYLKSPGLTPEEELRAMHQYASALYKRDLWYKLCDLYEVMLKHPALKDIAKQDLLLAYAKLTLTMQNMDKSLECLHKLLDMPTLTPLRRGQVYILTADTMSNGYGFYYRADEENYKAFCGYYLKAMKMPKSQVYGEALQKLVYAVSRKGDHKKVIELVDEYCNDDNRSKIRLPIWGAIKTKQGNSYLALEKADEAVEVFEALYKYKYDLANTCMSLGSAYYMHDDYTMALAMFDEALVELGPSCDDARPGICKWWIGMLGWFNHGKATLDKLYLAHAQRVNAEAKAKGLGPVLEEKHTDALRPFDDGRKKAKEKKPKTLKDLDKQKDEDILEEGLNLDE